MELWIDKELNATYCASAVILGSLERRIIPFEKPLQPAVCKSPYERVFIIGLRGSELDISLVLGVTIVVIPTLAVATATGTDGEMLVVIELSL